MGGEHQTVNTELQLKSLKKILIGVQYQSPAVTALPEGEPRGCAHFVLKNGAYLCRYAPFIVLQTPIKSREADAALFCCFQIPSEHDQESGQLDNEGDDP